MSDAISIEDIYAELYAIAGRIGTLDEALVGGATRILGLPHYAESDAPQAQLADDIKRVIEAIPDDVSASDGAAQKRKPSSNPGLKAYARWYFSLDEPGTNLTHRRKQGVDPGGTGTAWMNQGVVYRVAAGLLQLWAEDTAMSGAEGYDSPGYLIDEVQVTLSVDRLQRLVPAPYSLRYFIRLLSAGPHILILPYKWGSTRYLNGGTMLKSAKGVNAIMFGKRLLSGDDALIEVNHAFKYFDAASGWPRGQMIEYRVDRPLGCLVLKMDNNGEPATQMDKDSPVADTDGKYRWVVTALVPAELTPRQREKPSDSDYKIIDEPANGDWVCDDPDVGTVYRLRRIRNRKRMVKNSARTPAEASVGT